MDFHTFGEPLKEKTNNPKPIIFHIKLSGEIDPRSNRYIMLALEKATKEKADYIILEIDTYGGALNDADDIRTALLNFKKPIYAYINKDAASAGALISIACDSIYMSDGASIGAATVVTADGSAAPDKYQSYMRSIMRSTAEANGRNPQIAEAMVDQTIVLQDSSIKKTGKVITFSTSEAIKYKFCEAKVNNIEDILKRIEIQPKQYIIKTFSIGLVEKIIAIFLNPYISGLLILCIIGGIYFEMQSPGIGFPLVIAVIAAILYFVPYYLNGLTENWEILLFIIGIGLLGVELFVIPGFGIFGILGIAIMMFSLVLSMINNIEFDFSFVKMDTFMLACIVTGISVLSFLILFFFGSSEIIKSKYFQKVALSQVMDREAGFSSSPLTGKLIGKVGKTYTILKPSGKVIIDDIIYDAISRGGYIEIEKNIEVISEEGTTIKVKEIQI